MATEYASLRAELKQWEKIFHAEHGRKATPDDIRLVHGLADKYKRFKTLSKSSTQKQQPTTTRAPVPSKPIIVHSKPTENDRDPLPPSARPNPFSPVKRTTGAQPAKPDLRSNFPSFPNLFASPTARSYTITKNSPPGSPNPFLSSSIRAQPDSPFTAARKRIRGEGEGEDSTDSMLMRPDKKRRSTMTRSVSASTTTAAPGLFASGSSSYGSGSGNLFGLGKSLDLSGDVLEESPVKQSTLNGVVYKPIFDDDDIFPKPSGTSGRGTTSRTVSAPVASFFGRKVDARDSQPTARLRRATDSEPGPSVQSSRLDNEDEQMEEDEPARNMSLLAPTPVKGEKNGRWKGKTIAKPKKGRDSKSKLKVDEEDEEDSEGDYSHHSDLSVMEVGWRIMGPLHSGALAKDNDEEMRDADDDDDDENFRLLPSRRLWSMSRRGEKYDQEEEPERVQIDVADEVKEILQLSPAKPKVDGETLVRDILSGKGDRTKRAEVWLPGDGGDESDDWESEGAGWWEAEL